MRKISFFLIAVLLTMGIVSCGDKDSKDKKGQEKETSDKSSGKVEKLLSEMTVEEKVGQMTQVNLNMILKDGYGNKDGSIDPEKLKEAVNKYKVGSILNAINHAYDLNTWHSILTEIQDAAKENEQGIPVIYGIDAIHGTTYTLNSTLFPHNIGVAASRNTDIAHRAAEVTALETRASGIRWNFDPVFDAGRNPVWPRFPETFGEDPYIIEQMGVAMIKGYEQDDLKDINAVASCMKHFIGYSDPETGWDRTPSYIPEIVLREYYLPQFKAAIEAGSSTIMINSGEVNGIPVHANKYLLTDVLRDELGFEGLVVTDWEDVNRLHQRHNMVSSMKEAVKKSVLAGIDMSMTPNDYVFAELLAELYEEDEAVKERVNESVKRILQLKEKLGLFDNPYPEEEAIENFGKPEYADDAMEAALQTMTLLKNDNDNLPLSADKKVLLAGPNANNVPSLHGCWSYTWQGKDAEWYPESTKNIKEAFEAKIGKQNVISASVPDYDANENYDPKIQLAKAAQADHIVLCLGENAYAESPGSIADLNLDPKQIKLAKAAIKTGKPVSLVLVEGRPRVIKDIADDIDGILMAYWPGSKGADAIAEVVFGDYNPGGKLPFTYPRDPNKLIMYDYKWTTSSVEREVGKFTDDGYNPQFPFGHGLSYTSFEYSDFTLDKDTITSGEDLKISVTVTNTGDVAGDEVIEVYTRDMYATITPSLKRLRKFKRISLESGASETVTFSLNEKDISFVNHEMGSPDYERVTEEGEFRVMIGGLGFELEDPEQWKEALSRPFKASKSFYFKK